MYLQMDGVNVAFQINWPRETPSTFETFMLKTTRQRETWQPKPATANNRDIENYLRPGNSPPGGVCRPRVASQLTDFGKSLRAHGADIGPFPLMANVGFETYFVGETLLRILEKTVLL